MSFSTNNSFYSGIQALKCLPPTLESKTHLRLKTTSFIPFNFLHRYAKRYASGRGINSALLDSFI